MNELEQLARADLARGYNPFSTPRMRNLWRAGFDGLPLPPYNAEFSYNWRAWRRGQLCAQLSRGVQA